MKGVRFTTPMAPFGAGDTALLPDGAANTLFASKEAEPYAFPDNPHAHEAGYQPPSTKPIEPPAKKPVLTIKKK
jgi:hypothetical protein